MPFVNFIAVIVAAVAAYLVGALWYGPLFGKQWRELMGFVGAPAPGEKRLSMMQAMSGGFVATLVLIFVLANFLSMVQVTTIGSALTFAFWIWLAVAAVMSNMVWYENRPVKVYFINASHYLVAILLAALVLAWWPW